MLNVCTLAFFTATVVEIHATITTSRMARVAGCGHTVLPKPDLISIYSVAPFALIFHLQDGMQAPLAALTISSQLVFLFCLKSYLCCY
jgi:hypothetical protein